MELPGKKVMIFAENLYEDLELHYPRIRLIEAGADVVVAGTGAKSFTGKHGVPIEVDGNIRDYNARDFDALVIPGGWCPDRLRRYEDVLAFVRQMNRENKVIASICHGPWVLVSADVLRGKKATCVSAIKDDVRNAGAEYVDAPVIVDGNLITSRVPPDLPDFCREIIRALS